MEVSVRSFRNVSILALALGVSAFTFAQDAGQSSSAGSSDQGASSAKSSKAKSSKSSKSSEASSESSSSSSGQLSAMDKQFVMKAGEGGLAEVELGQLAASKGNSDAVKQFGQKMVDDHSKANDQLKTLAQQKGVTLPTELKAADKQFKAKLEKQSGEAFDKMYMQHMVTDHKKDVAEFKKASQSAKDSDVKNFASETLPTLEGHLKTAQQDMAQLGGGSSKHSAKKGESAQQ